MYEKILPPRGVGLLVVSPLGLVFVKERETKEYLGKYAEMHSLPMGTLKPREPHCEGIARLLREEVPWLVGQLKSFPEWLGTYRVAKRAWATIYVVSSNRIYSKDDPVETAEIGGYAFAQPLEALSTLWLRQGVDLMLRDYSAGWRGKIRPHFRPVESKPPFNVAAQ